MKGGPSGRCYVNGGSFRIAYIFQTRSKYIFIFVYIAIGLPANNYVRSLSLKQRYKYKSNVLHMLKHKVIVTHVNGGPSGTYYVNGSSFRIVYVRRWPVGLSTGISQRDRYLSGVNTGLLGPTWNTSSDQLNFTSDGSRHVSVRLQM